MLDTNVLFSLLLFPNDRMKAMMQCIFAEHTLVLSSFVLEEFQAVIERKFPARSAATDRLLSRMSYELVYTPREMEPDLVQIRDSKDYPVIYTAITENIDVLITGDKDFADIEIEKPEIVTPSEFIEKYV